MGNDFAIALGVIVVLFHGFLQSFVVVNLPIHLPFPQQQHNNKTDNQSHNKKDHMISTSWQALSGMIRSSMLMKTTLELHALWGKGGGGSERGKNSLTATTMLLLPL
jgi:hypothetical protein